MFALQSYFNLSNCIDCCMFMGKKNLKYALNWPFLGKKKKKVTENTPVKWNGAMTLTQITCPQPT